MQQALLVLLLLAAVVLWRNEVRTNPLEPRREGHHWVVTSQQVETRFLELGRFEDTYMIFGGQPDDTVWANVDLSVIERRHAAWLAERYPDFHRCASPGAAHAKRMIEHLSLVAADGAVRRTLQDAWYESEAALQEGGDRVCVALVGHGLAIDSSRFLHDGSDLLSRMPALPRPPSFRFVERAEIVDCRVALASP